ncbi:Hypothetical_protein [Hexamita inflata]|uniref:Hypothetical_protein n=1 Tax=Hexamita inflata TaxID=28002 RepID=A0AA86NFS3_9EUKA|nr:Hypothetical protein HINF_LOCUS6118 [Hexamita inflata]
MEEIVRKEIVRSPNQRSTRCHVTQQGRRGPRLNNPCDLMIQNRDMAFQDPTKVNKETRDFFSKNRHEFINSKQYPTNVKSEVKLGHCLYNFYQITNKGFQYLVDMRFNKKQKYVSLDTKCETKALLILYCKYCKQMFVMYGILQVLSNF